MQKIFIAYLNKIIGVMSQRNTISCGNIQLFVNLFKYFVDIVNLWYHKYMKIEIVRQRRKTLVLKLIDSQNAILKAPAKMPDIEIQKFLSEKKNWIEKGVEKFISKESFAKDFDLKDKLYLNGEFVANARDIVIGFDKMNEQAKEKARRKYYQSNFYKLAEMARDVSDKSGLTYDVLKAVSSVKVWGSYNSKRVMKLNWKLVMVPQELAYYVICHELSHSKHFNHKPQFWQEVERLCPDYKQKRKALDNYSFLLGENI